MHVVERHAHLLDRRKPRRLALVGVRIGLQLPDLLADVGFGAAELDAVGALLVAREPVRMVERTT
jgi:hypothetical protein